MELLLTLAAIILIVAVERLHLPVAPAAVMIVLVAAEVARAAFPIAAAAERAPLRTFAPFVVVRSAILPVVIAEHAPRLVAYPVECATMFIVALAVASTEHPAAIAILAAPIALTIVAAIRSFI